jgi:lactate dehydrogenase-like 2-hydroxyacid dehydrogenase
MTKIVIEKDHFLQVIPVILDPATTEEHRQAWVNFFSHDVPDFLGWCHEIQGRIPGLFPATVSFAENQEDLRRQVVDADGVIIENLRIDEPELTTAPHLSFVQRFGTSISNIDVSACVRHNVTVEVIRRRVNIAVAEQAFMLMIALAKRAGELNKLVRQKELIRGGFSLRPYDTRYSGSSNYAHASDLKTLNGATFGVIGMGEVGREIASRCAAFGMNVLYTQRNRIPASDEWPSRAVYCSPEELVSRSDFISINLPLVPATHGIFSKKLFECIKPGAILVNVARAELIDRGALMEALDSNRLGGFGLDVGYEEPARENEPLLNYPNVMYMPHTAIGNRRNALQDLEEMCLKMWRGLKCIRGF